MRKMLFAIAAVVMLMIAAPAWSHDLTWDWTQGAGGVPTGFNIFRKKAAETAYTLLATTAASARSYSDSDRAIGNCYAVTASNDFGASASVIACALGPDGAINILILK